MNKIKNKFFIFSIIFFSSPIFLSLISNYKNLLAEWILLPKYSQQKISNIYNQETSTYMFESQFLVNVVHNMKIPAKFFFNKFVVLINEIFDYLDCFKLRYYFQYSDNKLLKQGIPAITFLALPFLVISFFKVKLNFTNLFLLLSLALPSYLTGQKNFFYLFPVSAYYVYIISSYISKLKIKSIFQIVFLISLTNLILTFLSKNIIYGQ